MYDLEMGFKFNQRSRIYDNTAINNSALNTAINTICLIINLLLCGYIIYYSFINMLSPLVIYILSLVYLVLLTKIVITNIYKHHL
jgi:hypothetical protein